jgi:hypothetical protein
MSEDHWRGFYLRERFRDFSCAFLHASNQSAFGNRRPFRPYCGVHKRVKRQPDLPRM